MTNNTSIEERLSAVENAIVLISLRLWGVRFPKGSLCESQTVAAIIIIPN
ncbi:hypothetical protein [[Phormidium ambiguum] IAM M-71]|nr:hypothetical protein [Phormidium ambiguum]